VAYRLELGQPVGEEIRRIAGRQLAAAIEQLRVGRDKRSLDTIHAARRCVKKVRALLRLVRPALERIDPSTERRLRNVNHMCGSITDATAIATTWRDLAKNYRRILPPSTLAALRAELERRREEALRRARHEHIRETVTAMLVKERSKVANWRLRRKGFPAVAPGLEKNVRAARRAMARTLAAPNADHYHTWRRRVKTLWLHLRLLEARCGQGLAGDRAQLESLDGVLGQCHDCALLQQALQSDVVLSRQQAAHCLRALRRHQLVLRGRAYELGRRLHEKKPKQFIAHVQTLWRAQARRARRTPRVVTSWPPAA